MRKPWFLGGLVFVLVGLAVWLIWPSKHPYRVRAIFNNAGYVVSGEQVRVGGVAVGEVKSVSVTKSNQAAIVFDIKDKHAHDFRTDARCMIRPQSLLGERYIDCRMTEPRASGEPPARQLLPQRSGKNKGIRFIPVQHTGTAVDLDLVNNIFRKPRAERFALILNELGTGLAGRGEDLNQVIRNSSPVLRDFDKLMKLLKQQHNTLNKLVNDSDLVLSSLSKHSNDAAGFIEKAGVVAQATAEKNQALKRDIQQLPGALKQLQTSMNQLNGLSNQLNPVASNLKQSANGLASFSGNLAQFSKAATPAFDSLGDAAVVSQQALTKSAKTIGKLRSTTKSTDSIAGTLAPLLQSFVGQDGIRSLLNTLLYQATASNGYDSLGHYMRASLVINTCATYAVDPQSECLSKFSRKAAKSSVSHNGAAATASNAPSALNESALAAPLPAVRPKKRQATNSSVLLDYVLGSGS